VEKLVYLLHKSPDAALDAAFTRTLQESMVPALRARGASGIVLNVADLNEPVRESAPSRLVGEWDALAAAVHFWIDNVDTRFGIEEALAPYATRLSGYLVCESVVQKTPRTWRDGERRPGVTQLAVIAKAKDVPDEEFYHNWQQGHSTLSFALHPLRLSYVRNDVARVLTPGAPNYRMIVLEHWAELRDFTDDSRYFGTPEVLEEMYRELPGFADNPSTTTGPMSEYAFG
jgi:hypothetical protein